MDAYTEKVLYLMRRSDDFRCMIDYKQSEGLTPDECAKECIDSVDKGIDESDVTEEEAYLNAVQNEFVTIELVRDFIKGDIANGVEAKECAKRLAALLDS